MEDLIRALIYNSYDDEVVYTNAWLLKWNLTKIFKAIIFTRLDDWI